MNRGDINDLFKDMCYNNVLIQSGGEPETHFGRVIISAAPFQKMDIESFLGKIRSSANFPYLLLAQYDYHYGDNFSDNIQKNFNISFFILDRPEKDNPDSIDSRLGKCERIAEQCIGYLRYKFRNSTKSRMHIGDVQGEAIGPVMENIYGIRNDITLLFPSNAQLAINQTDWRAPQDFILPKDLK